MTASRLHPGHAILAALLVAAALLAWRAVGIALAPLPAPPAFAPPALADRALLSRVDPFFPAEAGSGESLPVTALPFSLHGVRADSATGRGSAIIATGDGQQQLYGVGDMLTDGVTLAAIAADHVVLDRGGTREALWLDSAGGAPVQQFDPALASASAPPQTVGGAPMESAPPAPWMEPDAIDQATASPSRAPGNRATVPAQPPAEAGDGE